MTAAGPKFEWFKGNNLLDAVYDTVPSPPPIPSSWRDAGECVLTVSRVCRKPDYTVVLGRINGFDLLGKFLNY